MLKSDDIFAQAVGEIMKVVDGILGLPEEKRRAEFWAFFRWVQCYAGSTRGGVLFIKLEGDFRRMGPYSTANLTFKEYTGEVIPEVSWRSWDDLKEARRKQGVSEEKLVSVPRCWEVLAELATYGHSVRVLDLLEKLAERQRELAEGDTRRAVTLASWHEKSRPYHHQIAA